MSARCRVYLNLKQLEDLEHNKLRLWWQHGRPCPYWSVEPNSPDDKLTATPLELLEELNARTLPVEYKKVGHLLVIERLYNGTIRRHTVPRDEVIPLTREEFDFLFILYEPDR